MVGYGTMGYGVPIFIATCCLCSISLVLGQKSPMVTIKNGTLEGTFMTTRKGRQFEAFRGVPFAQPPIGQLRFESPQPSGSWNGVRSAKEDSNVCVQRDDDGIGFAGSEDCLYLNVYKPKTSSTGKGRKYPVMIFIYGGGWTSGSADSAFYGPQFFMDHDIVLVNANYRLGALGFLSTQDLVCPGNQGLKDQALAIKWVHENIAAFNGDPNSVTIFGESSGATTVHYHMIHPQTRDYFHRAISESGDVMAPFAVNRPQDTKKQSITVGQFLKCPTDKSSELIRCLKTKNANDIIAVTCPDEIFGTCPVLAFRPLIEPKHPGAYITEEPEKSLRSGKVANIPWLTGINAQEGAIQVASIFGLTDKDYAKILDENFEALAPLTMGYDLTCPKDLQANVSRSIRKFYFGDKKIDLSVKWTLLDMYTDAIFYIGSHTAVKIHLEANTAPVYYYYFNYRGTNSFSTLYGDPVNNYGVAHADELEYLFPVHRLLFPNSTLSEEDNKVVDVMTKLWVNFATSGNPTPTTTPQIPFKWTPVRTSDLQYLHIRNSKDIGMAENLFPERVKFWSTIPYRGAIDITRNGRCKGTKRNRAVKKSFANEK